MKAHISYRPNSQKETNGIKKCLTTDVLTDICIKLTGQTQYDVQEVNDTYNRGRLVFVEYAGITYYVTLSEQAIEGRNSSMQSVPTAINLFYADERKNKKLCYYFLPYTGNPFTDYHILYYRLLRTAGVKFLNLRQYYKEPVLRYTSIDELIQDRDNNRDSNRSNNASFVSKNSDSVQIYAKTYGASKYESTILTIAVAKITKLPIELFAVSEQDLNNLPASSLATIRKLGNIKVLETTLRFNRNVVDAANSDTLRNGVYTYNLLSRLGAKRCPICGCEIPEIIQGAHIWGVSEIKNAHELDSDGKYTHATSGENGLWLCQNHHKLFDTKLIVLASNGHFLVKKNLVRANADFIKESCTNASLPATILTDNFKMYLSYRNTNVNFQEYTEL